jgi:alpha-galactosidase
MTPAARQGLARAWLCALFLLLSGCQDRYLAAILPGPPPDPPAPETGCEAVVPPGVTVKTPPMGWNSWNAYGCGPELTEAAALANADALVARGLDQAGYRYFTMDECWQSERSPEGELLANPGRFPRGMGFVADHVRGLGLTLGINTLSDTCERAEQVTPGSLGFEAQDAALFASWNAGLVKYRRCGEPEQRERYLTMREALDATGAAVVFSVTSPPFLDWQREVGHTWRSALDFEPRWESILVVLDTARALAAYTGPSGFTDADLLQLGNGALSESEARAHFALWAILASPLMLSTDLTRLPEPLRELVTNPELIALNQDPLALQAVEVRRVEDFQVLAKPLASCGARGVLLLNRGDVEVSGTVTWLELGLLSGAATVRDLVRRADLGTFVDGFSVNVPARDAVALRIVGQEPPLPSGSVYLSDLAWTYATSGYGPIELDASNGEYLPRDGHLTTLRGATFEKALGVHAPSLIRYRLGRRCTRFDAVVGIDDETNGGGSVTFEVWADGEKLFDSGLLTGESAARAVSVDLTGRSDLRLLVTLGGDQYYLDHASWADARLSCVP